VSSPSGRILAPFTLALAACSTAAALPPANGADTPSAPRKEPAMESAKRRAPVAKPVLVNGIRYEQLVRAKDLGFAQGGGVIAAIDAKAEKILWTVQLYKITVDPAEELDAQEVYVKELALAQSGQALLATDERKRVWSVDLATHEVTQVGGPVGP
jgi:hypothetical protein